MIIKSIDLENYRPYKGHESINFAEGDKNITIIQGQNDSGKTSLINAFTWCLYGKEPYRNRGEDILNKSIVKQIDVDEKVSVKVTIIMKDNLNRKVTFSRSQEYIKIDNNTCNKFGNEKFEIYRSTNGEEEFIPITENFMDTYLPEELCEYFLFDGEQLINFFGKKSSFVKRAVYNLSQLNLLENMKKHVKRCKEELYGEFKNINPNLGKYSQERDESKEHLKKDKEQLKRNKKTIEENEEQIENLHKDIKQYGDDPKAIEEEKISLENQVQKKERDLERRQEDYTKYLIKEFPIVMAYDDINNFEKISIDLADKHSIPAPYKKEFLKSLIDSNMCICGTELTEDSECYKNF